MTRSFFTIFKYMGLRAPLTGPQKRNFHSRMDLSFVGEPRLSPLSHMRNRHFRLRKKTEEMSK